MFLLFSVQLRTVSDGRVIFISFTFTLNPPKYIYKLENDLKQINKNRITHPWFDSRTEGTGNKYDSNFVMFDN